MKTRIQITVNLQNLRILRITRPSFPPRPPPDRYPPKKYVILFPPPSPLPPPFSTPPLPTKPIPHPAHLCDFFHRAPASFNNSGNSPFLACKSEFPPICFLPMKMLGTVRWPVRSARTDWIADPSSIIPRGFFCQRPGCLDVWREVWKKRGEDGITDLVQFKQLEFDAHVAQSGFRGRAVGAVGFAEDGCLFFFCPLVSISLSRSFERTAHGVSEERSEDVPTGFSSMMVWTLVLVADMLAGLKLREPKKRRRNEMVGNWCSE